METPICSTPRRRRRRPCARRPPLFRSRPSSLVHQPRFDTGPAPVRPKADALLAAATALLPFLEAGRVLDAATLRETMSGGFRCKRRPRCLDLEGRLRGRRSGPRPVRAALRPRHAPRSRGRTGRPPRPCSQCWRPSPLWNRPRPGAPKSNFNTSSSRHRYRSPTPRCRPRLIRPGDIVLEPSAGNRHARGHGRMRARGSC